MFDASAELTFHLLSQAFIVTIKVFLPSVKGEPVFPFDEPGTAVSPGTRTCNLTAAPGTTVTFVDVYCS